VGWTRSVVRTRSTVI